MSKVMSGKSIQHFSKEIIHNAHHLKRRRGIPCWCAQVSRHLCWAVAIAERLTRRVPRYRTHPEKMTLSFASRFWVLLRRIGGKSHHPAISITSPQTRERHDLCQSAYTPDRKIRFIVPQAMAHKAMRLPSAAPSFWAHHRLHNLTAAALSQQIRTIERTERFLIRLSLLTSSGERVSSSPVASFLARQTIRPLQVPAAGSSFEVGDIPAQVQKRHRRLEKRLFLRPPEATDQFRSTSISEHPVVVEKSKPRNSAPADHTTQFERKPRSRISTPEPPVNIGQITDAVLKQLDRRLVAARERMGRV